MKRVILFTTKGERVPVFQDTLATPGLRRRVYRIGWRMVHQWTPGFAAAPIGRGYRVATIWTGEWINGSIMQEAAIDRWWIEASRGEKRFPNIAAVEMYLRAVHGSR